MPARLRRLLFSAALLVLVAGCAHRPPSGPPRGTLARVTVPGEPFTRADPAAPFAPSLLVTIHPAHADLYLARLLDPALPACPAATRLYRGQRAFVIPFAENYAVARDSRTDLTYVLNILKADGTADDEPLEAVLWQEPVAAPDQLIYPATTVTFYAEPSDPLGRYQLQAHVQDHLGGSASTLNSTFQLQAYTPPPLPPGFDASSWFQTYYLHPEPELALPALSTFFDSLPSARRSGALPPLLGFYDQLLSDNDWLLPAFSDRLLVAAPDEAYLLSAILGFHLRNTSAPPPAFAPAAWTRLTPFRTHPWTDPDAPLTDPLQLEFLWGRFFASGLQAPVLRLLETLSHHADLGAAKRHAAAQPASPDAQSPEDDFIPPSPAELPPAVAREQVLRSTLLSLSENSRRHPLLRAYLQLTLRTGKLPEVPHALLTRLLQNTPPTALASPAPPTGGALKK